MEDPMATLVAPAKATTIHTPFAARLSLAGAAGFLVLLAVLHIVKPEFDPSWRMVSEYAIGQQGWLLPLTFLALVLSGVSLFAAIRSDIRTVGGRLGLAFLLANAVGMTIAAAFTTDPITSSRDQLTTHGNLHGLGALIGIPSVPLAALLISLGLLRNPVWSAARRPLVWSVGLVWASLALFALAMVVLVPRNGGQFGPDVPIGWLNRLWLLAQCAWQVTVAWHAMRMRRLGA
jgi:hypothetical protein